VNKLLAITILAVVVLAACTSPPEIKNVEVTRLVEIPVTVISEVEVTRFVQLTRLIDVIIEVTREKEIEVTRIIDKVITATPPPTETPTATPTPTLPAFVIEGQATDAAQNAPLGSRLLAEIINTRNNMQTYGFHIDNGITNGYIICPPLIERYDRVAAAPAFDVAGSGSNVQNAYHNYQEARSDFLQGAEGLTLNCRNFELEHGGAAGACIGPGRLGCVGEITERQWSDARVETGKAENILFVAINNLDKEFDVPG
jgi:hypothetical protein